VRLEFVVVAEAGEMDLWAQVKAGAGRKKTNNTTSSTRNTWKSPGKDRLDIREYFF
jgi:hypothetical protein